MTVALGEATNRGGSAALPRGKKPAPKPMSTTAAIDLMTFNPSFADRCLQVRPLSDP